MPDSNGPLYSLTMRFLRWRLRHLASHRRILGIDVYSAVPDEGLERLLLEKVRRALLLLREVDPGRFARLRRDVRRILVEETLVSDHYRFSLRMVVLNGRSLATDSAEEVAQTLVHEATHARIHRWGVVHTARRIERIERLCVEQEIAFARRLPGTQAMIEERLRDYEAAREGDYWGLEKRWERMRAWGEREGTPPWLLTVLDRIVRWRSRSLAARQRREAAAGDG